jgi:uncharacterized membrane protein YeaQ/YmgE (transglycosylase-associated protein family)
MSIILFLVFGLLVGLLARAIMPGRQSMGLLMTMVLGVIGSFVGGFLGSLFTRREVFDLHPAGIIGSILGALIVLFLYTRMGARRRI